MATVPAAARRKIVFATATLEPGHGGIARVGRMSARALIEAGHDVEIVSYLDAVPHELDRVTAHRVHRAHGGKLAFARALTWSRLRGRRLICDIAGLARGAPAPLRGRYATWIHGEEVWEGLRPDNLRVIQRADLVLVNSAYTLARVQRLHGPVPRAVVCPLSTEGSEPPPAARFDGPPTALMLSRIASGEAGKGHAEMIDAWPEVVARVPDARLLIVGKGDALAPMRARAAASPAAGSIEFTGFVPEADMDALWARAWVLALPSKQEGFGLVYVEAMSRATPAIASTADAGAEVNADGVSGFNVDLSDPAALPDRLTRLLSDRDACARIGAAGLARWRERYRYESFRARFLAATAGFLGGAPATADAGIGAA